jgi:hypothetical protein
MEKKRIENQESDHAIMSKIGSHCWVMFIYASTLHLVQPSLVVDTPQFHTRRITLFSR